MKKEKEKEEVKKEEKLTGPDRVRNFFYSLVPYIIIAFVVFLIRAFIITPIRVKGPSMNDYLHDGDILLLSKVGHKYDRFDVIVANISDGKNSSKIIKRIIAFPGESIEYKDCKLYINGKEQKDVVDSCITSDFTLEDLYGYTIIPENYYFVMGDNRKESSDSRDWRIGLIKDTQIDGRAIFRLWPFKKFGSI